MEFIDYDDIEAVKAGVQEAGMIMGGDYLFKFEASALSVGRNHLSS